MGKLKTFGVSPKTTSPVLTLIYDSNWIITQGIQSRGLDISIPYNYGRVRRSFKDNAIRL
mgnify:CR=1 FL=1